MDWIQRYIKPYLFFFFFFFDKNDKKRKLCPTKLDMSDKNFKNRKAFPTYVSDKNDKKCCKLCLKGRYVSV